MSVLRLPICVGGVYSMFLLWAIAQERLSIPFPSIDGGPDAKFKSVLFLNTCQSAASAISAFIYLYLRRKSRQPVLEMLGLVEPTVTPERAANGNGHSHTNGDSKHPHPKHPERVAHKRIKALLIECFRIAVLLTTAAPFGFAALSHISYPTMVLGKSCKLVPVMIMNVLLYRRKFAAYKYLVVAMVTAGITMFMAFSNEGASKKNTNTELNRNGLLGITYLLINLVLDGTINSTQDEMFSRYKVTGQQMMFFINFCSTIVTSFLAVLPLPYIPVIHPSDSTQSELTSAIEFIRTHPSAFGPLLRFALTGAMGQLFIYETLQHFGSLTLVTITLTRKLFTMMLSVVVYNHKLTLGQWAGAAVVFAGIGVEAWVKRKDIHAKAVAEEKEKARIKSL